MDTSDLTIAGVQPSNTVKIQTICYWYILVDTHDLSIAGVQIWIWDKYLNLNLRLRGSTPQTE